MKSLVFSNPQRKLDNAHANNEINKAMANDVLWH
jgi:hypothetical protein